MSEQTKKRVRLGYAILLSFLLMLTAILFIVSCITVYRSGESPFTRESVGAALRAIAVPVCLTLVCAIGGGILHICMTPPAAKLRARVENGAVLRRLSKRLPPSLSADALRPILAERRRRAVLALLFVAALLICAAYPVVYAVTPANFLGESVNDEIRTAALIILGFALLFSALAAVIAYLWFRSVAREVVAVKAVLADRDAATREADGNTLSALPRSSRIAEFFRKNGAKCTLVLRISVFLVALVFIVFGILNGGMGDVIKKAIKICTECIGMG